MFAEQFAERGEHQRRAVERFRGSLDHPDDEMNTVSASECPKVFAPGPGTSMLTASSADTSGALPECAARWSPRM